MLDSVVEYFLIDLVGNDHEVVTQGHGGDPFERLSIVGGAGRITRTVDDDGLGPRSDDGFERFLTDGIPVLPAFCSKIGVASLSSV